MTSDHRKVFYKLPGKKRTRSPDPVGRAMDPLEPGERRRKKNGKTFFKVSPPSTKIGVNERSISYPRGNDPKRSLIPHTFRTLSPRFFCNKFK
ncbi:unnamed protein product [Caenorhabditis auriculariae]|uniref:Uncharacterized protein n=1 Tax=Caenorhabditis auriculariae TaxID=2777116 RepID=A0A8S1HHP7_9PELO|nr:unnamed protein product [Caenorhabditis auriculariae]